MTRDHLADRTVHNVRLLVRLVNNACPIHGVSAVQGPDPWRPYRCPRKACGEMWTDTDRQVAVRALREIRAALLKAHAHPGGV